MNVSMSATMKAFSPSKPEKQSAGGAPESPIAGLMALGLEAQLINKDTTMSTEVKLEKLAALSPKAKSALDMATMENEAKIKRDQIDAIKTPEAPEEPAEDDPTAPAADDAEAATGSTGTADAPAVTTAESPPATYANPIAKPSDTSDNEHVKGAMVDVRA